MTDDDAFLRFALHIDYRVDVDLLGRLLELLYPHLHRIRDFLIVIEQNLFANDLTDKKFGGLVRQLVLVKIRRTVGQELLNAFEQHVHAKLIGSRNGKNLGIGQQRMPLLHQLAYGLLVARINLVDDQDDRNGHRPHLFKKVGILLRVFHHISYIQQDVSVGQGRFRESQHVFLHLVIGFQHARGV